MVGVLVITGMQGIKKIVVIRLGAIGDILLTTPLLRRLQRTFPDATIDYCTKASYSALLASNPRISSLFTNEHPPLGPYDLVVDLQNNRRSRSICRSLKASRIVRYHKQNWKKWLLVHCKLDFSGPYRSVVDRYQHSLAEYNIEADTEGCEIYPSSDDRRVAHQLLHSGRKTLALCFGARHLTKCYPPERYASLLLLLLKENAFDVVLLGGKEDSPKAAEIMKSLPEEFLPGVINLSGACSLMQTAAVLERCDAVLCNDTGLMHIASAFGKRLFVLFGSSSPAFGFLPYNAPYELFEVEGLKCRPCSHIGRESCPEGHFRCMNDLSERHIARRIIDYMQTGQ
jgi:ADP-heptose:LPS heptosyltransferase